MNRALVAIRTNRWSDEEQQLLDRLRQAELGDIAIVFHDRPDGFVPPAPVIDVNDAWVQANNLRITGDWGWRCGDYFYYAMRQARPEFDYYWLIEPDVFFTDNPKGFFDLCGDVSHDLLGFRPEPHTERGPFVRGLRGVDLYRALFAMTRISGRAIDTLFAQRVEYSSVPRPERTHTNDELFVFSNAMANPDLSVGDLEVIAPEWFEGAHFATNPDIITDAVPRNFASGRIFHPVRSHDGYCRALAQRLTTWPGYLGRSQPSIAHLSDDEIDEIANLASERMKTMLKAVRG